MDFINHNQFTNFMIIRKKNNLFSEKDDELSTKFLVQGCFNPLKKKLTSYKCIFFLNEKNRVACLLTFSLWKISLIIGNY